MTSRPRRHRRRLDRPEVNRNRRRVLRALRYEDGLDEVLHDRPTSGPEPTDEERYWDSGTQVGTLSYPDDDDPPWTDTTDHREDEL